LRRGFSHPLGFLSIVVFPRLFADKLYEQKEFTETSWW